MTVSTGLFQFDPFATGEPLPAHADLVVDPIGQVIAMISVWTPEGYGASSWHWSQTAILRVNMPVERLELIWEIEGELSLENQWNFDAGDGDIREILYRPSEELDSETFAIMARIAEETQIRPSSTDLRVNWAGDEDVARGVPNHDWADTTPTSVDAL